MPNSGGKPSELQSQLTRTNARVTNLLTRMKASKLPQLTVRRSVSHQELSPRKEQLTPSTASTYSSSGLSTVSTAPTTPGSANSVSGWSSCATPVVEEHYKPAYQGSPSKPPIKDTKARRSKHRKYTLPPSKTELYLNVRESRNPRHDSVEEFAKGMEELVQMVDEHLDWTRKRDLATVVEAVDLEDEQTWEAEFF